MSFLYYDYSHTHCDSMTACNKFGESIMHMAARRSNFAVLEFLLAHGGSFCCVDDYGRIPLHDACWRLVPQFDVVAILMDQDPSLILASDRRGFAPLSYVQNEHWRDWCAYLYYQRDKYWPVKVGSRAHENVLLKGLAPSDDRCLSSSQSLHVADSSSSCCSCSSNTTDRVESLSDCSGDSGTKDRLKPARVLINSVEGSSSGGSALL